MQLLSRTCNYGTMNVQRIFARGFVLLGGLIWIVGALFAPYGNRTVSLLVSGLNALVLIGVTAAVFLIGYFYERLAAALLIVASAITIVYGIVVGWESGVWMYMGTVLIAPMLISGLLFALAARMENVCRLKEEAGSSSAPGAAQPSA